MSWLDRIQSFIQDPPPTHIFELSADGIAWSIEGNRGFRALQPEVLNVNPLMDNVLDQEALITEIRAIAPVEGQRPRRIPCALILPDFCARLTVLDFDTLPSDIKEQASLIRFRIKKSLPFDVDTAALSFHSQTSTQGKQEVVVAAVSHEILSRYESSFRAAGYHPGIVTVSSLSSIALMDTLDDFQMMARLSQRVLTILITSKGNVNLTRCVELTEASVPEVSEVLFPTLAYVEDRFGSPVQKIHYCGFDGLEDIWSEEIHLETAPLRSELGQPTERNAGLLGYLQSARTA